MSGPVSELSQRLDDLLEQWGLAPRSDEPEPVTRWRFHFSRTYRKQPWTCGQCFGLVNETSLEAHCRWHLTTATITNDRPRSLSGGTDDYNRSLRFVVAVDGRIELIR
jgi:hypothetical protein